MTAKIKLLAIKGHKSVANVKARTVSLSVLFIKQVCS